MTAPLRVACFVPTFNAGDTTRGIELARSLVLAGARRGRGVEVTFVAPRLSRPSHEGLVTRAGFPLAYGDLALDETTVSSILRADHDAAEFVTDLAVAKGYIDAMLAWLRAEVPDLVLYGFLPPVGIATKILGIPSVTYLPFPIHAPWVRRHLLKDLPDPLEHPLLLRLPRSLRRLLVRGASHAILRQAFFTQPTLAVAGRVCGWRESTPNLLTMLSADVELVNDLPAFFRGQEIGPRCRITGPLYARPPDAALDPRIAEALSPDKPRKVFLSMGSSGEKSYLMEAIAALARMDVHALAVVPPAICSLAEVARTIAIPPHLHLTDAFVPAHQVNALADVAVIHGGQGTVQTALHAGTPVVGIGMQAEQSSNLENLVLAGAGIRIPRRLWTANRIRQALTRLLEEPSFRQSAQRLKAHAEAIDGWQASGDAIWQLIEARATATSIQTPAAQATTG